MTYLNRIDPRLSGGLLDSLLGGEVVSIFSCAHCGFAHWFMDVEASTDFNQFNSHEVNCLECEASIPAKASSCPQCGWSWEDHS